jgi:hypothetical protein
MIGRHCDLLSTSGAATHPEMRPQLIRLRVHEPEHPKGVQLRSSGWLVSGNELAVRFT